MGNINDMMKALIIIAGAAIGLGGCSPRAGMPDEYYRKDVHIIRDNGGFYSAYIDRGAAFGVSIGMKRKIALDILSKSKSLQFFSSSCELPKNYKVGERYIYDDDPALVNCITKSWTDYYSTQGTFATGWIHVHSADGAVDKIDWSAGISTNLL